MSVAIYDFRLTEEQFWRLTPAKFSGLTRRHEAAEEMHDFRMAYIISTIVNVNRGKKGRAVSPKDFMPSKIKEKKKKKRPSALHKIWKNAIGQRIKEPTKGA